MDVIGSFMARDVFVAASHLSKSRESSQREVMTDSLGFRSV